MKIELPKVGRVMVLEGLSAAERVEFRYDDWWGRARSLWLWFVGGWTALRFSWPGQGRGGARPGRCWC